MRDFIIGIHWLLGWYEDPYSTDAYYDRKPPTLRLKWINFWRNGVRGFKVRCDLCGRTLHVHHFAPGGRMHMCGCVEIGNIMGMVPRRG